MHFRQTYNLILIMNLFIISCEKLPTDPGEDLTGVEENDGIITWGGFYNDYGYGVFETADGGYAVVGSQYSTSNQEDLQLVKFDSELDEKTAEKIIYSGIGLDSVYNSYANDIQQTADGGYVTVGNTFNGSNYDVQVVKFSPQLAVEWQDTIKGDYNDFGNSIQQTTDGGYVICGTKYDGTDEDIMLWKITVTTVDDTDTPSYVTLYNPEASTDNNTIEYGNYVQQTSDGGYVLIATIPTGIQVTKLASDGTTVTFNTADTGCDEGNIVKQLDDGSYIIIGNKEGGTGQQSEVCINTFTSAGVAGTPITMGGAYDDKANSIMQTEDDGFVFTGSQYNSSTGDDLWVVKLRSNLTTDWAVLYGGNYNDNGASIMQTDDGGYIVAGSSVSYDKQSQIMLLKIESDGCVWSDDRSTIISCGFGL